MSARGVVVADTTPLNYLILINQEEILQTLFGEVWIPEAVFTELGHPKAPKAVILWLESPPPWLRIVKVVHADETIQLGKGETEAITLAIENDVAIVLMDERQGRAAANVRGLLPVGTLTILDLADERNLRDGVLMLEALKLTTFRAEVELLQQFEARMKARKTE